MFAVKWQQGVLVQNYRGTDGAAFGGDMDHLARVAMKSDALVRGTQLQTTEDMLSYLPKWLSTDLLQLQGGSNGQGEANLVDLPIWYDRKKAKQHNEVCSFLLISFYLNCNSTLASSTLMCLPCSIAVTHFTYLPAKAILVAPCGFIMAPSSIATAVFFLRVIEVLHRGRLVFEDNLP